MAAMMMNRERVIHASPGLFGFDPNLTLPQQPSGGGGFA
jgi:hypothetical protein